MKHLKNFQENSEYQQYITGEPFLPNVSYVENDNQVYYNPDPFNRHEYVDLGLPSGTLWATMNVGATSETEYGNYYMYGMGDKTYDRTDTPYAGMEDPLDLSKDTAHQVMGGEWHMPTEAQIQELRANTTYTQVTDYKDSGINGGLFTAQNGNSIFFPNAGRYYFGNQQDVGSKGYYRGSSPFGSDSAYDLNFDQYNTNRGTGYRDIGFSVRGVID